MDMRPFSKTRKRVLCRTPELIENFDKAFNAKEDEYWECHHRLETHFSDGTSRPVDAQLTKAELIALGMYWDRPAEELIFITRAQHNALHNTRRNHLRNGTHLKESTKLKISEISRNSRWYNNSERETFSRTCPEGFTPGRLKR